MKKQTDEAAAAVETKKAKKRGAWSKWLSVIAFVLALSLVVHFLNDIMRKKFDSTVSQQIVTSYYKEPKHSIDVLCLGASTVRNGVSELEMFQEYGFTTYSRATSVQLPVVAYHLLRETLSTQELKAVVLDANSIVSTMYDFSEDYLVGKLHEAIDYMPWSKYKVEMIRDVEKLGLPLSFTDFLFPLYTYHDRWTELNEDDFTYRTSSTYTEYALKGQNPTLATGSASLNMNDNTVDPSYYVTEDGEEYFAKIVELCRAEGIPCVMIKTPSSKWTNYRHDVVQTLADQYDVEFIDMNLPAILNEIDFNPKQDFSDSGAHPNMTGAKKISGYLGNYLSSICTFKDKRENPAYAGWHTAYEKYSNYLAAIALGRTTNLVSFLDQLDNPNYITMIATRNDTSLYFNEDLRDAFAELGINVPFQDYSYLSYVALLDGSKLVYERADDDTFDHDDDVTYSRRYDGHRISISSSARRNNGTNAAKIYFDDKNYSTNKAGFNFAVYDRSINMIVAKKSFNCGVGGKDYRTVSPFASITTDPVACLEQLRNPDYISVISVCYDGTKYIPGTVNEKLVEMGLLPLNGKNRQSYLAVLNGSEIIYNEYGKARSELSYDGLVDGIEVSATSNTTSNYNTSIQIGTESVKSTQKGIMIYVYDKTHNRCLLDKVFYRDSNYVTSAAYSRMTDLREILDAAALEGNDILCLYSCQPGQLVFSEDERDALRSYGILSDETAVNFASVVHPDGQTEKVVSDQSVSLIVKGEKSDVELSAEPGNLSAKTKYSTYQFSNDGLYLLVYHSASDSVIWSVSFTDKATK